jgi:hypothetical protein
MRSMRPVSVLVLVPVSFLLAFAGTSHAGAIGSPVEFAACGDFDVAEDAMADPNTIFSSAGSTGKCEKLCRKGGNLCRGYVKKTAACLLSVVSQQLSFALTNCEIITDNGEDERACKQFYRMIANETKDDVRAGRDFQEAECDGWAETCDGSCQIE